MELLNVRELSSKGQTQVEGLDLEQILKTQVVENLDFSDQLFKEEGIYTKRYQNVNFTDCVFKGKFKDLKFSNCTFTNVTFSKVKVKRYGDEDTRDLFTTCKFVDTTFASCEVAGVRFVDSILENTKVVSSFFEAVDFETSTFKGIKFYSSFVKNLLVSKEDQYDSDLFVDCKTFANQHKPMSIEYIHKQLPSKKILSQNGVQKGFDAKDYLSLVFAGKGHYYQYVLEQQHRTYAIDYATPLFSKLYLKFQNDWLHESYLKRREEWFEGLLDNLRASDYKKGKALRNQKIFLSLVLVGHALYALYANQEAVLQSIEYLKNLSF